MTVRLPLLLNPIDPVGIRTKLLLNESDVSILRLLLA
jgi:hypothetical protein